MKIEIKCVTKHLISGVKGLDPVSVILEDLEPMKGKITIECYGTAWSAYWGSMGKRSIAEFFCSCDSGYISNNFSNISPSVTDYDGVVNLLISEIVQSRKCGDVSKSTAREQFDCASSITDESSLRDNSELMSDVLGSEWFMVSLPEKPNHHYEYLCRIIETVQDALRLIAKKEAA